METQSEIKTKKEKIKNLLQIVISLGLGVWVFYLVYKELDINKMQEIFKNAHWLYVIIPILLCLLSNYVRAVRWNMLIEPVAPTPKIKNTFCAVMFGYLVNHIFPRAGEVARCGILTKYEKAPMSVLFGTVITERAFDMLATLLFVFFTIIIEFNQFQGIIKAINIHEKLLDLSTNPILWGILLGCSILAYILFKRFSQWSFVQKIKSVILGIWDGLKSVTKVKNKLLFLFYTFLIIALYYFMLYTTFWMFDFTSDLSLSAGAVIYVFGALGMIVPVQGGIGTYEFMTILAMRLYGITTICAGSFAILSHLIEIIVNCVVGFVCFLILPLINKKRVNTQ